METQKEADEEMKELIEEKNGLLTEIGKLTEGEIEKVDELIEEKNRLLTEIGKLKDDVKLDIVNDMMEFYKEQEYRGNYMEECEKELMPLVESVKDPLDRLVGNELFVRRKTDDRFTSWFSELSEEEREAFLDGSLEPTIPRFHILHEQKLTTLVTREQRDTFPVWNNLEEWVRNVCLEKEVVKMLQVAHDMVPTLITAVRETRGRRVRSRLKLQNERDENVFIYSPKMFRLSMKSWDLNKNGLRNILAFLVLVRRFTSLKIDADGVFSEEHQAVMYTLSVDTKEVKYAYDKFFKKVLSIVPTLLAVQGMCSKYPLDFWMHGNVDIPRSKGTFYKHADSQFELRRDDLILRGIEEYCDVLHPYHLGLCGEERFFDQIADIDKGNTSIIPLSTNLSPKIVRPYEKFWIGDCLTFIFPHNLFVKTDGSVVDFPVFRWKQGRTHRKKNTIPYITKKEFADALILAIADMEKHRGYRLLFEESETPFFTGLHHLPSIGAYEIVVNYM